MVEKIPQKGDTSIIIDELLMVLIRLIFKTWTAKTES